MYRKSLSTKTHQERQAGAHMVEAALLIALISLTAIASVREVGKLPHVIACQYAHKTFDVARYLYFRDGTWHCRSEKLLNPYW